MNSFASGLPAAIEAKAEAFADAVVHEMELEDTRHHVKIAAIERIMRGGDNPMTGKAHSFSSAEALVNTDAEYAAHLEKQRDAARARILARGAYDAAIAAAKVCETV